MNIKKITLLAALTVLAAPAFAQISIYESFDTQRVHAGTKRLVSHLGAAITSAVISATTPKTVEWARAVQSEEHKVNGNGPLGVSFHGFPTRKFNQEAVAERADLYNKRMTAYQKAIKRNQVLSKYTFVAPRPTDLTRMSNQEAVFLLHFFNQSVSESQFDRTYAPITVTHPQGAETRLTFNVKGNTLILLINSRDRKVYFFTPGTTAFALQNPKAQTHTLHPMNTRNGTLRRWHPREDYNGMIQPHK